MSDKSIVMLAQEGELAVITHNLIETDFPIDRVIFESPEPRGKFLKRRVRRMGYLKVFGQVLFQLGVVPLLKKSSVNRIAEIKRDFNMDATPIDSSKIVRLKSINSKRSRELLEQIQPDIIVVIGTRIISKRILNAVPSVFINIHCGITPLYRGAHGGYWALVQKDPASCGVTVHHVDPGIDTGEILEQGLIEPTSKDNYYTYPYLQFAVGAPLMKAAVGEAVNGQLRTKPAPAGESNLWSHPTLAEYLWNRFRHGVR